VERLKIDPVRLFLRICFLGFILGKFKKRESKSGRSRGFVDVVFPRPAGQWTAGVDFLWEPKENISEEIKKGDWVVFFGYHARSGWKAKWVQKIF
jgi:hypothetical protein